MLPPSLQIPTQSPKTPMGQPTPQLSTTVTPSTLAKDCKHHPPQHHLTTNRHSSAAPITAPAMLQELVACIAPYLLGTRINYPLATQAEHLPGMRLNCSGPQLGHLLSRRLNCSSANPVRNLYIMQCTGYHASRLALPLKWLAATLQIRAHFSLGPQSLEGHSILV